MPAIAPAQSMTLRMLRGPLSRDGFAAARPSDSRRVLQLTLLRTSQTGADRAEDGARAKGARGAVRMSWNVCAARRIGGARRPAERGRRRSAFAGTFTACSLRAPDAARPSPQMAVTLPLSGAQAPDAGTVVRLRVTLADGARTTVHVAAYDTARTELRVALLGGQQPLAAWCAATGHTDAIVGGFFVRPGGAPLGEVRTHGIRRRHMPFAAPWDRVRACVHVEGGTARIARRDELPRDPRGDLLQAGPLLVRDSHPVYRRVEDPEGFRLGAFQFDSDIGGGRYPRAALGMTPGRLLAVAVDGRGVHDAGLTLEELGALLAGLGATDGLNLDGGGSTSLVCGGRLRNRPRAAGGLPEPGGRPITTALLFVPR